MGPGLGFRGLKTTHRNRNGLRNRTNGYAAQKGLLGLKRANWGSLRLTTAQEDSVGLKGLTVAH